MTMQQFIDMSEKSAILGKKYIEKTEYDKMFKKNNIVVSINGKYFKPTDVQADVFAIEDGVRYTIVADSSKQNELKEESSKMLYIENVIFNPPATIVLWVDGTKTVVKANGGDQFDPEKGLAMAIAKKALGNKGAYFNVFKKFINEPSDT